MLTTARSFLASHRDASKLVQRAEKFSVRLPVVGRVAVPPPDQLAFYGVVGGLAALGLIDWPVAIAIGVGQAVVARHFNDQRPAATEPKSLAAGEVKAAAPTAPAFQGTQDRCAEGHAAQDRCAEGHAAKDRCAEGDRQSPQVDRGVDTPPTSAWLVRLFAV